MKANALKSSGAAIAVLSLFAIASCASAPDPELSKLRQERDRLEADLAASRSGAAELEKLNADLSGSLAGARKTADELQGKLDALESEMATLRERKSLGAADYERRLAELSGQLDAAKAGAVALEQELAQSRSLVASRETALATVTAERDGYMKENQALRRDLTASGDALKREVAVLSEERSGLLKRIEEMEREKAELRAALDRETARLVQAADQLRSALKEEISRGNIEVKQVDNVLIVSMKESVVFAPDRAELNTRYERILREMAAVFQRLPEKVIRVEGHTAVAVSSPETLRRYPTSWDLGAGRAVAVVRFLQEKAGIDPARLVAVSHGEFRPLASNATEATRQRNRRVEIVLVNRPLYESRELTEAGR